MKSRINNKQEFRDLEKHIKENKSYNVSIQEAKVRETGFTDQQRKELVEILAEALTPIKQDIAELKQDMIEVKKDIVEIKRDLKEVRELPIIKEALKNSKKR